MEPRKRARYVGRARTVLRCHVAIRAYRRADGMRRRGRASRSRVSSPRRYCGSAALSPARQAHRETTKRGRGCHRHDRCLEGSSSPGRTSPPRSPDVGAVPRSTPQTTGKRSLRVYGKAYSKNKTPTRAVARHFRVTESAAAKWVAKCRNDLGLLPKTTRGRAKVVDAVVRPATVRAAARVPTPTVRATTAKSTRAAPKKRTKRTKGRNR